MAINIGLPDGVFDTPCIKVMGVGGAGCNAVNNMIEFGVMGAEFAVANTDAQALKHSLCDQNCRIQLGSSATKGLGAGSNPDIGKIAAEESINEIISHLTGASMVFITAGMGGGTGTGAAPIIAKVSRELDILTVGVVTTPFDFEGLRRRKIAMIGLDELEKNVDTLIIIPNQNLFRIANEKTTFKDVFKKADNVLRDGVNSITALMVNPGLINLDFADIKTVMGGKGRAMMGTGEANGENRAIVAAESAISNPLLDNNSMRGASGVLINISGGDDLTLYEVDAAVSRIKEEVDNDANIIFGSTFDESLNGCIKISVVATGVNSDK
uniref:Cell division protein FtsZ n=1 Tax=Biomphalaria glabrata TaxID=6526 RepID=A0A2C9KM39_BIOGL